MGGNHIESKRAVIALCCPAGTGTDGTLTLADTTGLCLNESNTTSALYKIKLKCKVKCFVVFFYLCCSTILVWSKYISWIYLVSGLFFRGSFLFQVCFLWHLNSPWTMWTLSLIYREVLSDKKCKIQWFGQLFYFIWHSWRILAICLFT